MKLRSVLIILLLFPGAPLAAEDAAGAPSAPGVIRGDEETVFSLIFRGGWLMVPIGLCSIVVLTVAIERAISLRRSRTHPQGLLASVFDALPTTSSGLRRQMDAARRLDASRSVLGAILRIGVLKAHRGPALAETFLSEAAAKQIHFLKRRLRPFSVVASLAPLLGLLGTIYGMITCFENAASTDAASRAESLAKGIYGALVTTAAGLTVAIPSIVLYHYFQARVDRLVDEIEESVNDFLEHYFEEGAPADSAPAEAVAPASEAL